MVSADTDSSWILRVADTFLAHSWHQVFHCSTELKSSYFGFLRDHACTLIGMVCFCWIRFFNQYVLVPVYEDFASCGRRTGAKRRAPALPRWFPHNPPWRPILTLFLHQYSFPVNLALPAPLLVWHSTQTDKLPVQCQLQRNDCIGAMPSSYNKECIVLGQLICHSLIKLWWQKTAFMFDTVFRSVRRTIYYCIQAQIIFI